MTGNLERRVAEHNNGYSSFTKRYLSWKLIHYEQFPNQTDAIKREKYFKSASGRRYVRKLNIIRE